VSKIKITMQLTVNPHTHHPCIKLPRIKTTYIVVDGGQGGKPSERVAEGFPRVAFLWFISLASKEMNQRE